MGWIRCGSGGSSGPERIPTILGGYSLNMASLGTLSHTFAEAGTYQYISFLRLGDGGTVTDPVFKVNNNVLTPTRYEYGITTQVYYYGEITVSADDVLSAVTSMTSGNSGFQLFVLKDCDLSLFSIIGFYTNTNQSFPLPNDEWVFQIYLCGYYRSNNNFSYRIERHHVNSSKDGINYILSIPTPNSSAYYYGFTYAITV